MALITCPECGKENVSNSATSCPNCGYDINLHYKKIELETQRTIREERINKSKEKAYSILKNKKVILSLILIAAVVAIGIFIYKSTHKEVIHGISWGMRLSDVEKKEKRFSGVEGYYDEENNYYAVSEVDFFGEKATLLYMFKEEKLSSITAVATYDTYENAYNIAYNICKEYGMPISFEDKTDIKYYRCSVLTWNIDGTTIELVGEYNDFRSYIFLLKPYDGTEFGEEYIEKGKCEIGSALSWGACKNEIAPWNTNERCYEHGCCVIGCPNDTLYWDEIIVLCPKHDFLFK